jgi:hypothetical protein
MLQKVGLGEIEFVFAKFILRESVLITNPYRHHCYALD